MKFTDSSEGYIIRYITICNTMSIFDKIYKLRFELHVQRGFHWSDSNQSKICPTSFGVDPQQAY
jgi:hypothetical protein